MPQIESDEYVCAYADDQATKQAIYDKLLAFFKEHECFSGESYYQSDGPQIGSQELMGDILDLLQFRVTWK